MKTIHYLLALLCLSVVFGLASCSDDDGDKLLQAGISNPSWGEGQTLEISHEYELAVSFTAAAKWVASVTQGSEWCRLLTTSGAAGEGLLKLTATGATTAERTARIAINVEGYAPTNFDVVQRAAGSEVTTEAMAVNRAVDDYLAEMYLWNDEYQAMTRNFNQDYEEFFYNTLGSMTTNTLDKKRNADGTYSLFSYIEKRVASTDTRATRLVEKELTYSFGITGMLALSVGSSGNYTSYFCVQGVYPDSPAEKAGIKRGTLISAVDGNKITAANVTGYYYDLVVPDHAQSLTLTEAVVGTSGAVTGERSISIASQQMYCNPVICHTVKEVGGHRIGYLAYASFDAGFDQELFDALCEFKNRQVTDLVLDLRYNGGGHVLSANLLATCIAGAASQGKVFTSFRYNDDRMAALGNRREEQPFSYPDYDNLDASLTAGSLDLPRIYCLTGSGTASSSELVINALRGIDVEVVLIGETTTGKNVGMEYADRSVRGSIYRIVPITFQSYNAKGYGDYENGFTPDYQIDETNPANNPGMFYLYREYASDDEPLYAKAVELITGQTTAHTRAVAGITLPRTHTRQLPAPFRPGYNGMLKPANVQE